MFTEKKSLSKWTHAVQTHVVQGSAVVLCSFVMCRFLDPPPWSGYWTVPPRQGSLVSPFYSHTSLPLPTIPNSQQSVTNLFSISNFVTSGMLPKWNHIVYNLWDWLFPLRMIPLRVIKLYIATVCSYLLLSSVPWYGCTTVCLIITHGKACGLFPVFGCYKQSHCEHLRIGFCVNISFCF